jgi:hypothetical protein
MEFLSPSQCSSALELLSGSRTATADEWRLVRRFIAERQLAASLGLSVLASASKRTRQAVSMYARTEAMARRNGWTFSSGSSPTPSPGNPRSGATGR